ncbi:ABC-F family ATP-binding cassette domain-containing protein [Marinilabiliaceae bacterium ANBcel2]|nr:ABC-F family ATP-binding cassette domain-containing protein [Marinilabiliaceae bacterium ANBcel2]
MIAINQLTVDFGGFRLFDDVSFLITDKDRIGLVGKNGAGKSTLLKIIASENEPSFGNVAAPKDVTIGYLPQHIKYSDTTSVREEAEKAFSRIVQLQKEIDNLTFEINSRNDYNSDDYLNIIDLLSEKSDQYNLLGGNNYLSDLETTLKGLGFKQSDLERPTSEFSGGWRMRIELAKILLRRPDLLLLDEPTNHLDIESIQWLEEYLKSYSGALVLISHDRAFLDNITDRTIEISMGKIYDYKASYSEFIELRKERREKQIASYKNQQKKIEETEAFIEKFRYKATKAVQVQSRIKQLDKMDRIEIDEFDTSSIKIKFPPAPHSGKITVKGSSISKSYPKVDVLDNIDFELERGEKVAFVGKNGEGKTTLARIILGEIEYSGTIELGHQVKIGYFAQNEADKLDNSLTVFETVDKVARGDIRTKIRDLLGAFLFSGETVDKKVSVLSGGERTRLAMVLLLLEPVNFLVMDEPTNHLDMRSKEILKEALLKFEGTVLLVSHDRDFLNSLADKVYEFSNKKVHQHIGGIYDFLEKKKLDSLKELEIAGQAKEKKSVEVAESNSFQNQKEDKQSSYEKRREINRKIKRTQKAVDSSEAKIEMLESRISELDAILSNPDEGDNYEELCIEYENTKKELTLEMERWEEYHIKLEEYESLLSL